MTQNAKSNKPLPKRQSLEVSAAAEEKVFRAMSAILSQLWWRLEPIYRMKFKVAAGAFTTKQMPGPGVHITHDVADPLVRRFVFAIEGLFDASARRARLSFGQKDIKDWEIRDKAVYEQIKRHEIKLAQSTIDDLQAATVQEAQKLITEMQQELLEGQQAGETLKDKTDRLAKFFGEAARNKARLIAITESARGQNYGFLAGTADMDVVTGYRWVLSADACERCHEVGTVNGRPRMVKKGQPFATGQSKDEYYATSMCAPLHPGCRCTVAALTDWEQPDKWDATVDGM
jgi:hypothetical protein